MLLFLAAALAAPLPDLREGDIVLHVSRSSQSAALREATGSPYTHTGIVLRHDGALAVLEAVQPVRWTALDAWVARGEHGHVAVLRLADPALLDEPALARLHAAAEAHLGKPYDPLFQWTDDRIYCSELVTKAYRDALGVQLGELVPLRTFRLDGPAASALVRARTGGHVDLDEPVVAPSSLLTDPDLVLVYTNDPALRPPAE